MQARFPCSSRTPCNCSPPSRLLLSLAKVAVRAGGGDAPSWPAAQGPTPASPGPAAGGVRGGEHSPASPPPVCLGAFDESGRQKNLEGQGISFPPRLRHEGSSRLAATALAAGFGPRLPQAPLEPPPPPAQDARPYVPVRPASSPRAPSCLTRRHVGPFAETEPSQHRRGRRVRTSLESPQYLSTFVVGRYLTSGSTSSTRGRPVRVAHRGLSQARQSLPPPETGRSV